MTQIRLDHVLYQNFNFAVIQGEVVFYIPEQAKANVMEINGVGRIWLLFATLIVPLLSLGEWNLVTTNNNSSVILIASTFEMNSAKKYWMNNKHIKDSRQIYFFC